MKEPFIPERQDKRVNEFYTIPVELATQTPFEVLEGHNVRKDGYTDGWVSATTVNNRDMECLANSLLAMLKQYGRWAGISRIKLNEAITENDPDVFGWVKVTDWEGMVSDLLQKMEERGWIKQSVSLSSKWVIYLTPKLISQIRQ